MKSHILGLRLICLSDNVFEIITFNKSSVGNSIPIFKKLFVDSHRELFNMQEFEDKLLLLVTTGVVEKGHKYKIKLNEAMKMVKNEWY